ncbi:MAG: ZIP family metal transporter [Fulvivirga sp.]|nr:ZIP family metal transporter [Fulvivirga sp.]
MTIYFILLFFVAMGSGLLSLALPRMKGYGYKLALVFAGAYLFAITIIHILPELFSQADQPSMIGFYVLVGFFLQQVLEYFTDGAEHGHIHDHTHGDEHSWSSSLMLLLALLVHSLLEGAVLTHSSDTHAHADSASLLAGILLHKAPAAFALMSIMLCHTKKSVAIAFLVIFSLGSPAGMYLSNWLLGESILSANIFQIILAIVCGNFLHISTTIVFESNVDHNFNIKKLGVSLLGAFLAVFAELWL